MAAVFGGVLRDIVCNEIPRAFSDHRPYAVCAFAGGWVMVLAHSLAWPQWGALLAAAGERWPEPLTIRPGVITALLLPPALMLAWLAVHWRLPQDPARGENP